MQYSRYWEVPSHFQLEVPQVPAATSHFQLELLQVPAGSQSFQLEVYQVQAPSSLSYSSYWQVLIFSLTYSRHWQVLLSFSVFATLGTGRYSVVFSFKYPGTDSYPVVFSFRPSLVITYPKRRWNFGSQNHTGRIALKYNPNLQIVFSTKFSRKGINNGDGATTYTCTSSLHQSISAHTQMKLFRWGERQHIVCASREEGCLPPRSCRSRASTTTCRRRRLSSSSIRVVVVCVLCSANAANTTARRVATLS